MSTALLEPDTSLDPVGSLTERERSVFTLYAQGMVVKEIANILNISVKTAETHLNNIRRKLGHNPLFGRQLSPVILIGVRRFSGPRFT